MFTLLFPIFCFGVVVTGIVLKGLLLAFEENQLQAHPKSDEENREILRAFKVLPQPDDQQVNEVSSTAAHRT